jgi:hypothetical protein
VKLQVEPLSTEETRPNEHILTAKRCTVGSRGRNLTVDKPRKVDPTPKGLSKAVRPLQGPIFVLAFPSVGFIRQMTDYSWSPPSESV